MSCREYWVIAFCFRIRYTGEESTQGDRRCITKNELPWLFPRIMNND